MQGLPYIVDPKSLQRPDIEIGKIAAQANASGDGYRVPLWDVAGPMVARIEKELEEFISKNLEESSHFYVVMRLHKPPDAPNAIRALFFARRTACAPEPGLSLIEVDERKGTLKWHWTLPDRDTITAIYLSQHLVPIEERELLKNIIDYVEGRLGVETLQESDEKEKYRQI